MRSGFRWLTISQDWRARSLFSCSDMAILCSFLSVVDRLLSLGIDPIANVVAGGVVVMTVHLPKLRSVEVHRDRHAVARIPDPVDAAVAGQDRRGPVLGAPRQLPDLLQAGVIQARTVVQTLVALF